MRGLDQVAPWGDPNSGLNLHWFGLTDGWYDVQVGEHHLLRLQGDNEPGVDYQDSGHLRAAPYIGFWRYEDELHVRWRTRFRKDGDPTWESPAGDALISARQFQDELTRFDHELIEAMQARVEQVAAGWRRPEIRIDIEQLRREQAHRSARLQTAMSTPVARKHTWHDVLAAVAELERRIGG